MSSAPSSTSGDRFSLGLLLIVALLFSWFLGIKNLLMDWVSPSDDTHQAGPPNILLIVADDLGYNDTNALTSTGLNTPHLKQLAERGATFTRHYADATCTPSRVAILTGQYPERSGFRPVGSEIPAEFSTIAQALKQSGYNTYLTGKWHAGEERAEAWPGRKGFDQWFGFLNQWELSGEVSEEDRGARKPTYHDPLLRENGGHQKKYMGHLTDILTDHTVTQIDRLQAKGKPWFLYHAFLAPHHPIQPAPRYASLFPDTPEGRYSALVTQMDAAVGRILQTIDRDNTLVVFISDNGGTNVERDNNYPFFGKKGELFEGSFRTPLIISWPGHISEGQVIDDIVMNVDLYPTFLTAAKQPVARRLDGQNLWPVLLGGHTLAQRSRSWEIYSPNVNLVNFSTLSASGAWRLTSQQGSGMPPHLYHLATNPPGDDDVSANNTAIMQDLTDSFWSQHWEKSLLPVIESQASVAGQTLYGGFDVMRTPLRYGFAIGLEIGPLPDLPNHPASADTVALAGQKNGWELIYRPGHGVEWHMGTSILRDASFEPSRCNAIILTGYIQPRGHLTKRDPRSELKLYSSGFLRDYEQGLPERPDTRQALSQPTFVNYNGRAQFSNLMLGSFSDPYLPNIRPQFADFYQSLFAHKKLSLTPVSLMDAKLCKEDRPKIGKL